MSNLIETAREKRTTDYTYDNEGRVLVERVTTYYSSADLTKSAKSDQRDGVRVKGGIAHTEITTSEDATRHVITFSAEWTGVGGPPTLAEYAAVL